MSSELTRTVKVKIVVGSVIMLFMTAIILLSGFYAEHRRRQISDFSDGWRLESGELISSDEIRTGRHYGNPVTFSKRLPDNLKYEDSLCFVSYNSNFDLYIDGERAYSYHTGPNLTGKGYGNAYHYVNLTPDYNGAEIRFTMNSVFDVGKRGRVGKMSIEDPRAYQQRLYRGHRPEFIVSVGMVVIGGILLLMCAFVSMGLYRYTAIALAVSTLINGLWLSNDTGMWRLFAKDVTFYRVVDHALMHIWIVPMLILAYLLTKERNRLYLYLILGIAALDIGFFLIARFAFDGEMAALTPVMLVYYIAETVTGCVMLISNRRFCDGKNVETGTKLLVAGFIIIAGALVVDSAIYLIWQKAGSERGAFSRMGFVAFFVLMVISLIRSWRKERETMRRNRFVNQMLQYAITTNDPDLSVRMIMEYVGTEFGADHVYIYENRHDGSFHNTYEWFRDEHCYNPDLPDYSDLSDQKVLSNASAILDKDHRIVIEDVNRLKEKDQVLYEYLKSLNVKRMVVGPLEYGGELIGLFGIDDMPAERCLEIADLIRLISYFVTQLLVQRNEKRNLVRYSYFDSLTGTRNRRGLEDFERTSGRVYPFGYLMCDINGLKNENDNHGHEAGDLMIMDIAAALSEVFGDGKVFRIGGDEFVAYSFDSEEQVFEAKVKRVRELFDEKKRSASIGYVFAKDPSVSREEVKEEADALMYAEKERYYSGRRDRRR